MLRLLGLVISLLGFTYREVERRLGLGRHLVCNVFNGKVEARIEMVLGIARAVGLSYGELFALAYPGQTDWERSEAAQKLSKSIEALCPANGRPRPRSQAVRA